MKEQSLTGRFALTPSPFTSSYTREDNPLALLLHAYRRPCEISCSLSFAVLFIVLTRIQLHAISHSMYSICKLIDEMNSQNVHGTKIRMSAAQRAYNFRCRNQGFIFNTTTGKSQLIIDNYIIILTY